MPRIASHMRANKLKYLAPVLLASRVMVALALAVSVRACGESPDGRDAATAIDAAVLIDASPLGVECAALGGMCVPGRWASCPEGSEPVPDVHSDCKPQTAGRGYYCCTPAPPTNCHSEHNGNCFVGECPPCWGPVGEPSSCQPERGCCGYICLD